MRSTLPLAADAVKTVVLDAETFARIDPIYDIVTIHRGHVGDDGIDWGGQCIGSLPFDFLLTIAESMPMPEDVAERIHRRVMAEVAAIHDEIGRLEDEPGYAESTQPWLH